MKKKLKLYITLFIIPDDFEKNTDSKKILFLGRFGKRKGIYDLIDVIEQICKIYPETKLLAGGDGEIEQVKKVIKDNI